MIESSPQPTLDGLKTGADTYSSAIADAQPISVPALMFLGRHTRICMACRR